MFLLKPIRKFLKRTKTIIISGRKVKKVVPEKANVILVRHKTFNESMIDISIEVRRCNIKRHRTVQELDIRLAALRKSISPSETIHLQHSHTASSTVSEAEEDEEEYIPVARSSQPIRLTEAILTYKPSYELDFTPVRRITRTASNPFAQNAQRFKFRLSQDILRTQNEEDDKSLKNEPWLPNPMEPINSHYYYS